jgi:hypothetical protein
MEIASNTSYEETHEREEPVSPREEGGSASPKDTMKGHGASDDRTANGIEQNEDRIASMAASMARGEGMGLYMRARRLKT